MYKRQLLNKTTDLLGFIDKNGRIIRFSQEWHKCLGWTEDDLKNIAWQDLFHPDEKDEVIARARASKMNGNLCEGTNRCRCKNGEYKICLLYTSEKANHMCKVFEDTMKDGCINGIAEIFDGDFASTGRGCYSQAWSVGEVLRAYSQDVLPYLNK